MRDLLDERTEVQVPLEAGEDAHQESDVPQVVVDDALDARILHLHRDLSPVVQRGPVHLRQRRRRDRLLVEAGENVRERPFELALDPPLDDRERSWRHLVL